MNEDYAVESMIQLKEGKSVKTLRIEFEIDVEDAKVDLYQTVLENTKAKLDQNVSQWLKKYVTKLESDSDVDKNWLEFLDNIDQYAVDTGIEDFSINHEYYIYGGVTTHERKN